MPKTDTMMVKKKLKKFNTKNIYNDGKKKKVRKEIEQRLLKEVREAILLNCSQMILNASFVA